MTRLFIIAIAGLLAVTLAQAPAKIAHTVNTSQPGVVQW